MEEKKNHKKQIFQRQAQLSVNYLKNWGAYRSRLKTQMAKKN